MKKPIRTNRKGFNLLTIFIVLGSILLLGALVAPSINRMRDEKKTLLAFAEKIPEHERALKAEPRSITIENIDMNSQSGKFTVVNFSFYDVGMWKMVASPKRRWGKAISNRITEVDGEAFVYPSPAPSPSAN